MRGRSEDIQMDKDDGASESGSFRKQLLMDLSRPETPGRSFRPKRKCRIQLVLINFSVLVFKIIPGLEATDHFGPHNLT